MEDLVGYQFNDQEVLSFSRTSKNRAKLWWVKCHCGKVRELSTSTIKKGENKSCGCLVKLNLVGQRFGKLLVLEKVEPASKWRSRWMCQCDCGSVLEINGTDFVHGKTKSCSCLLREKRSQSKKIHGMSNHRLSKIYDCMRQRCYNKNHGQYQDYGGRGIVVCEDWLQDRTGFYKWALENGYSENLTLDRMNNDGPYAPWNCRFASKKEQSRNSRHNHILELYGLSLPISSWAEKLGIDDSVISSRLKAGHDTATALFPYNLKTGVRLTTTKWSEGN